MIDQHAKPASAAHERALAALKSRYRQGGFTPPAWNETLDVILGHRSVRHYLPEPLPPGTLETLVAAAQSAASSSNLQAWSVIAVEDPERKARLSALAAGQKHVANAALFLVWLIDLDRLTQIGKAHDVEVEALDYTEAFLLGAVDAALAAQTAMIALESLGLGANYIGAMRNKPEEVAAELNLPPRVFAVFGMSVGIPDPARPTSVKPRLPQASVLYREQYGWTEERLAAARSYNDHARAFQREQGMAEKDWTEQSTERVRGPHTLAGRHVLREVLHRMGFQLR